MKGCNYEKRDKNESPFETLYNIYFADIYRFSYGITADREEAKDITQDTFMKLYNQLKLPVPLLNPRAWLYRVATSACLKKKRRSKFAPDRELSLDEFLPADESAVSVDLPRWASQPLDQVLDEELGELLR